MLPVSRVVVRLGIRRWIKLNVVRLQASNARLDVDLRCMYHISMAEVKTTIVFDEEMQAALEELLAIDGTKKQAIKKSLIAEARRRRQSRALLDWIEFRESEEGPIDQEHIAWADEVLDRQGVAK